MSPVSNMLPLYSLLYGKVKQPGITVEFVGNL